jgi:protein-disulfide isomerase
MRSSFFIGVTVLAAALVLILYGMTALTPLEPEEASTNAPAAASAPPLERPSVVFGNPFRGPRTAALTIVEFGDFLCEPCATVEQTLRTIVAENPEDVRVVWKDMPNTAAHGEALNAAVAARCADLQGKFWEYHDKLLDEQLSINAIAYDIFAEQLGLDLSEFKACREEGRTKPIVERDFEEGQRLRIDSTPYLFIGERRVSGALETDQLRALVEAELAALKAKNQ